MNNKPRILVAGSANMDIVFALERIPAKGETIQGENYGYIPGGKGANTAIAAARLGGEVIFCSKIGHDEHGASLIEAYKREGMDVRFVTYDRANKNAHSQTGLAAIFLEADGGNRIVVYPGASLNLSREDVEEAFLSYPDLVLLQFETNHEAIIAAVEFADEQGIPAIIDAGPACINFPFERLQEYSSVEVISPNEIETAQITGIKPIDADTCLRACMKLKNMANARYVVLKLSDRGCFLYDGKYCEYIPSLHVRAVDSTAAGDCFTAALGVEYLRSRDIIKACKYANAAGAFAVTQYGASPSLPNWRELEEFMREKDVRL